MIKISRSIQFFIAALILFFITIVFNKSLSIEIYPNLYNSLHLLLEIFGVAVSFMIALQGWVIYPRNITRQRMILSAVFFAVVLFCLVHLMTARIHTSILERVIHNSPLFTIAERFTVALGLFISVIMRNPNQIIRQKRYHVFALIYALTIIWVISQYKTNLELLIHGESLSGIRVFIEFLISGIHLLTIKILLVQYQKENSINLLNIISGILFLILASINLAIYPILSDANYFLAHVFKGIAYLFLLLGIYRTVVEEPFLRERIVEEERLRIAEEFRDATQILPNILFKFRKTCNGKLENLLWQGGLVQELSLLYGDQEKAVITLKDMVRDTMYVTENHQDAFKPGAESSFTLGSREFMVKMKSIEAKSERMSPTETSEEEVVGFITEFTEWRKLEADLKNTQDRFVKAFHANPWLMAIISMEDWRYVDVNDSFLKLSKCKREDLVGNLWDGEWGNPQMGQDLKTVICDQGSVRNWEILLRDREGEFHEGILSAEVIQVENQSCMYVIIQDVTERKIMEREMARFDRLNAVGEMAATIAHEIRNPMTTVRGFLQMMGSRSDLVTYKGTVDLMIDEIDRANLIITEFLSLAKNKAVSMSPGNLNTAIDALAPLLSADAIASEKSVFLELGELPQVIIDEKEIRQLILNLVRNGLEAMDAGGSIFLRTFLEGNHVVFSVRDEGRGIAPEVLDKLGTPFLTTKESGNGLGLAVCYSIASRHHAEIIVNTGGAGTTFNVKFPIRRDA